MHSQNHNHNHNSQPPSGMALTTKKHPTHKARVKEQGAERTALGFHPDYGLTDEVRLSVLADADEMGVREAAMRHHLHPSAIYKWRVARAKQRQEK